MTDRKGRFPGFLNNILSPRDDDVFYHYCSVETFRLICETKTLRFSDINLMNDAAETRWGYSIFEHAANEILKRKPPGLENITEQFFEDVDKIINSAQAYAHPVICAFSREPDVLGQWRAYSDDGAGVAIGFGGKALRTLPATLLKCLSVQTGMDVGLLSRRSWGRSAVCMISNASLIAQFQRTADLARLEAPP